MVDILFTVKVYYRHADAMKYEVHPWFRSPVYAALGGRRPPGPAKRAVEVLFTTEKLKRQFSDHRELQKRWGKDGATKISLRLQQLVAAVSLADMRGLPGRCHELTGDRDGHLAVDVHHPFRLVFRPSADPPPSKEDGGLDWDAVESVTVTEVVDYH